MHQPDPESETLWTWRIAGALGALAAVLVVASLGLIWHSTRSLEPVGGPVPTTSVSPRSAALAPAPQAAPVPAPAPASSALPGPKMPPAQPPPEAAPAPAPTPARAVLAGRSEPRSTPATSAAGNGESTGRSRELAPTGRAAPRPVSAEAGSNGPSERALASRVGLRSADRAQLLVNSRPRASLWVNGEARGESNRRLELSAGLHELALRGANGQEVVLEVLAVAGELQQICWDLERDQACGSPDQAGPR